MDRNSHRARAQTAGAGGVLADEQRRRALSRKQLRQVWNEADTIPGRSPEKWRLDRLGNVLRKGSFGTRGRFGWTVDYALHRADVGAPAAPSLEAIHAAVRGPENAPAASARTAARPSVPARSPAPARALPPSFPAPGTVRRSDNFPA